MGGIGYPYAHAKTQTDIPWILSQLRADAKSTVNRSGSGLQSSAHAVAVAMANNSNCKTPVATRLEALDIILQAVNSGKISYDILIVCIIALGTMCDARFVPAPFTSSKIKAVLNCLNNLNKKYPNKERTAKNCALVIKMINGDTLTADEESFLLTKLEV